MVSLEIKTYVNVKTEFTAEGIMTPRALIWEDGCEYQIDRVVNLTQATAMKCGGQGDRYTIRVNGRETFLYFERDPKPRGNQLGRWFVERRV